MFNYLPHGYISKSPYNVINMAQWLITSQLQNIMDLIPCKYNWIEDNEEGYGFIAQEVHSVFPQMRDKFEETYCSNNPDFHMVDNLFSFDLI